MSQTRLLSLAGHLRLPRSRMSTGADGGASWGLAYLSLFAPDKPLSGALLGGLDTLHGAGLPWWLAVVTGTLLLRSAVTPPVLLAVERNAARLEAARLAPEFGFQAQVKALNAQRAIDTRLLGKARAQQLLMTRAAQLRTDTWRRAGAHPAKSLAYVGVQLPLWLLCSGTMRVACGVGALLPAQLPGLVSGGGSWFPDLTAADPYYLVPMAVFALNMANMSLSFGGPAAFLRKARAGADGFSGKMALFGGLAQVPKLGYLAFGTSLNLFLLFVGCHLPVGIVVYWAASSLHQVLLRRLFLTPFVRRKLRLPVLPKLPQ